MEAAQRVRAEQKLHKERGAVIERGLPGEGDSLKERPRVNKPKLREGRGWGLRDGGWGRR